MKTSQIVLLLGAVISGLMAMGCWVLTQADAAITKHQGPITLLIMWLTLFAFVVLLGGVAFLGSRTQGLRSVVARALFLVGTCGTVVLLLFIISSKGMVLKLGPLPTILLSAFLLSTIVFWPRKPSQPQHRLNS